MSSLNITGLTGRMSLHRAMLITSGWAALAASAPAYAQEAADPAPEEASADDAGRNEIIVTAQRRAQSLQDVGIAVAAFEGDTLKQLGLSESTDIAQVTPGVYVSGSYGGQTQQYTIRGVTQSSFSDALEVPVAVYVDDIYIPAQQGHLLALFDIDRIEVLKGPQGTLFGRNATGGLVHTIIEQPTPSAIEGYADFTYARFNEVKAEGALNLPLSSNAAVRVAGYYSRIDNYWENRYPEGLTAGAPGTVGANLTPCCDDLGGGHTYAGRAQFKWEPVDALTVRFALSGSKQRMSTAPYTSVATIGTYDAAGNYVENDYSAPTETRFAIGPNGQNLPTVGIPYSLFAFPGNGTRAPGADWFGYVPISPEDLELSSDYAQQGINRASVWMANSHIDYDFGNVTLSSITGYQEHSKFQVLDGDGGPANFVAVSADANTRAFSQEFKLSGGDEDSLFWTAGAYFLDLKNDSISGLIGPRGSIVAALFNVTNAGIFVGPVSHTKTRSLSGFGQVEVALAEQWKLILGGRLIREHQEFDTVGNAYLGSGDDYAPSIATPLFPYTTPFADERTKTLWAGKAQIEYRPNSDLLVYAGINRGVKGGNYNGKALGVNIPDAEVPYKAETLIAYETGFKYGDRDFFVNASAFYYDYQDFQAFLFSNAAGVLRNQDSTVWGGDADIGFQLVDGLRATLAASYSHAVIEDYEVAPGVFRTVRPPYAPRAQFSAALNYTVPQEVAGGELSFNALANYASGYYHNLRNFRGNWYNGRALVNLSASWMQEPTGFNITAYVSNLFDKRYGQVGFDNTQICGCTLQSFGTPRTFGVTVGYDF